MFIVFEGIDGAGKSSHIPRLAKMAEDYGMEVVLTREPGGTPLGEQLRAIVLHEEMDVETELLLMFAARNEHVERVIKPALERGALVLCDRFVGSSYAFQGGGRGLCLDRIKTLHDWAGIPKPDVTFLFDLPTETAKDRMQERVLDKFESESRAFSEHVRNAYLSMIDESFVVIDSSKTYEEVVRNVDARFTDILEGRVRRKMRAASSPN